MATTINTYSVGLTLDAADYINKASLSGQETRRLSRAIEEARTPAEKYSLTQDRLNKALQKGGIDQSTYNRLLDAAKTKQEAATKSLENATRAHGASSNAVGMAITRLKGLAAAYVGFGTVKKSISLAIDAEQASASFEVLTGSIEDSTRLLSELRHFSDVTPLSTVGVRDAAKLMLSFNIPLEQVMENLKMLGDISGGSQQRFDSLTLAFAQMSAAGRLMGQDVLQMINAGFNPLQEISRKTGESMLELKKRMEDGAISSLEVRDAFMSATSEGGKYNGMMDRLAETMGGKLAVAMGQLEKAGIQLGQALSPLVIDLTNGFDQGISKVQILVGMVEAMVDGFRMMTAAAKDAFVVIKAIGSGQTYETMTQSVDHVRKLLDEIGERDRKRQEQLEIEARMRMNPATLDPSSPEYKEREERERAAAAAALETTQSTSIGVLASQIGDAISQSGAAFQQRDLLVPTAGEIIIAEAVQDAVDAIKENKFSRIR
jgi:tape measure domain-containing protein